MTKGCGKRRRGEKARMRYRVVFQVDDLGSTKVVIEHGDETLTAVARAAMKLSQQYHPQSVTVLSAKELP